MKSEDLLENYLLPMGDVVRKIEAIQIFMSLHEKELDNLVAWEHTCKMIEAEYFRMRNILMKGWEHARELQKSI